MITGGLAGGKPRFGGTLRGDQRVFTDGTRTVQEVADQTRLAEFDVGKALFGLIQAGFAHRVGRKAEETSKFGDIERERLVNQYLEDLIRSGSIVDDLGPAGRDVEFGYGLINARKAVRTGTSGKYGLSICVASPVSTHRS